MIPTMLSNASLGVWKTSDGIDILFPEQDVETKTGMKSRGGAFVCSPNFGTAPTDGLYEGVRLPKHGLVRTCLIEDGKVLAGNSALWQSPPTVGANGEVSTGFIFMHPWPHEVWVSIKDGQSAGNGGQSFVHRISVGTEQIHDIEMPCSVGFHPYFATAGDAFTLHYAEQHWSVYNLTVDEPLYVPHQYGEHFKISTSHGDIEIELLRGYEGYFIWTDRPDRYICVEPVCLGYSQGYRLLNAGEIMTCECKVKYTPR